MKHFKILNILRCVTCGTGILCGKVFPFFSCAVLVHNCSDNIIFAHIGIQFMSTCLTLYSSMQQIYIDVLAVISMVFKLYTYCQVHRRVENISSKPIENLYLFICILYLG